MTVDSAELRRLLAAATPGPWEPAGASGALVSGVRDGVVEMVADLTPDENHTDEGWDQAEADAALIVAAVNALPVLLDQLDTYREALRAEFFRQLPDMDYEVPPPLEGWAWQNHSWFKLLGLTDEECGAALQSKNTEAVSIARAALDTKQP